MIVFDLSVNEALLVGAAYAVLVVAVMTFLR